jgi:hypothetical protein
MTLKNLIHFYIAISVPLILLALAARYDLISSTEFTLALAFYVFIYHPLILGLRLMATYKISRSEFWRTFIPFWNMKYFGFLFFNRQKSF